jgi:hypothetical protein
MLVLKEASYNVMFLCASAVLFLFRAPWNELREYFFFVLLLPFAWKERNTWIMDLGCLAAAA